MTCMILLVIMSFEMIIIIHQWIKTLWWYSSLQQNPIFSWIFLLSQYIWHWSNNNNNQSWRLDNPGDIYRSPKVPVQQLWQAITEVLNGISPGNIIMLGDLNVSWLVDIEKRPLYNLLVNDKHYKQLISTYITDSKIVIDHIYTNIHVDNLNIQAVVLETFHWL